jgi:uncharacterized membrane protein YhaH (DUF805 family)
MEKELGNKEYDFNMFSFKGRMERSRYFLISLGLGILSGKLRSILNTPNDETTITITLLIIILLLYIKFSINAKRCHDLVHNGWWQFIPFYFLWLLLKEGELCDNEYGPNPKERKLQ